MGGRYVQIGKKQYPAIYRTGTGCCYHAVYTDNDGSVSAGFGIYDTMNYIKCDVSTICVGMAASMGAFLLAGIFLLPKDAVLRLGFSTLANSTNFIKPTI